MTRAGTLGRADLSTVAIIAVIAIARAGVEAASRHIHIVDVWL